MTSGVRSLNKKLQSLFCTIFQGERSHAFLITLREACAQISIQNSRSDRTASGLRSHLFELEITYLCLEYRQLSLERYLTDTQTLSKMNNTQNSYSSAPQTLQPVGQNAPSQVNPVGNTFIGLVVIVVPSCLILGTLLYKKYYPAYRAAVLRRQIETLERLWQLSPKNQRID